MERITFLIESTHQRITCLLNPEDTQDGLSLERSAGLAREDEGGAFADDLSDSPVETRGRGDTRLTLKLLFDTDLDWVSRSPAPAGGRARANARAGETAAAAASVAAAATRAKDVRDLTRPLWQLTEYTAGSNGRVAASGAMAAAAKAGRAVPRVRVFWGKGWEIPAVVESVAERYERFTEDGRPQRSWLTLRLLRVTDEVAPAQQASDQAGESLLEPGEFAAATAAEGEDEVKWGVHELLGGGTQGDQLWRLAALYYGDPGLWRLIALANDIVNPLRMEAGALLKIPPLGLLGRIGPRRRQR